MARLGFRDLLRGDLASISLALRTELEHQSPALKTLSVLRRWAYPRDSHALKIPFCPPLPLLWSRASKGGLSPADIVHAAYYREAWRERSAWERARILVRLVLIWPVVNLCVAAWSTSLNGPTAKRRTGKGIVRQLVEQLTLLCSHDLQAFSYYMFELYDDDHRRHASDYLQRSETKRGIYGLFKRYLNAKGKNYLTDKVLFDERSREHRLRTIPVLAVGEKGALRYLVGSELPRIDLFTKRASGRGGEGADWWHYDGAGSYRSSAGTVLTHAQLATHVANLSLGVRYIVCPRVENHPDLADLANGALSTIRIVTIKNAQGGFEATDGVFRMAVGSNTVVDNFHAGGIAANVDMETGELGPATDLGLRADRGWCDVHPSGAAIAGRKLPHWRAATELVERAHVAFPEQVVIGWDVAILADGACIVEGNSGPDLDIHQRCKRTPVGMTRLGELLAFNTQRALAVRDTDLAPPH